MTAVPANKEITGCGREGRPSGTLDFQDPDFQSNPWPLYEWYRREAPVCWSDEMKCYFVFDYKNAHRVLISSDFTSFHPFRRSRAAFGPSALDSEGSLHKRLRSAITGPFRPRTVAGYSSTIIDPIVRKLLSELLPTGRDDLAEELAWRVPMRVAGSLLGLPEADDAWLFAVMRPLMQYVDHAEVRLEQVFSRREELRAYLRAANRDSGADDGLSEADALSKAMLILAAATETTGAAIVNALARVAAQSGLFDALRQGRQPLDAVVTETLRHEPPLHVTLRYAAVDTDLGGLTIPQGAAIQVCLASANRDPAVFVQPDVWDAGRERAIPLTFGMGRHHCPGIGLAQLEIEVTVRGIADLADALWVIAPDPPRPAGRTFRRVPGLKLGYRLAEEALDA